MVPAVKPVLVRGMGLNFFDAMGQLTEGRGGRFLPGQDGALSYLPSGREPLIIAASRRGTPYRAKAGLTGYYPDAVALRYCTESAVAKFAEQESGPPSTTTSGPPAPRRALGLLLHAGALAAGRHPHGAEGVSQGAGGSPAPACALHREMGSLVDSVLDVHLRPAHRLNLLGLAAPLAGRSFDSRAELDAAVVDYLLDDARRSALGEDDPVKMTIGALHHGRAVLKSAVADGGITDESWVAGLRGWFESFVEGLASGPPALRAEQLAALVSAGVVRFVGPDRKFGVDRKAGTFTAVSPWVGNTTDDGGGDVVTAGAMVEALAPANKVRSTSRPCWSSCWPKACSPPDDDDGGREPGADVGAGRRPRTRTGRWARNGSVTEGLYVLGLQLSAVQWGTAIAAEARQKSGPVYRSGQRTLRDADEIARAILGS